MKIVEQPDGTEMFEDKGLVLRCMNDVEMRPVDWIWENYLPRGKLVLIGGQPATGKTTLVISLVAAETNGGLFPHSDSVGQRGSVIFISAEDDPEDTLKPRLEAAGVDMRRVYIMDGVQTDDGEKYGFLLSRNLCQLEATLRQKPEISMVVLDPLSAYLGAKDSHRDADVREVLGPLTGLAAEYQVCVIGITHLNKGEGKEAMQRFMGSTGIVAAARAAFLAAHYDDGRIFVPAKGNLGPECMAIKYDIKGVVLDGIDPPITTSKVVWLDEVDVAADDVLNKAAVRKRKPKIAEAKEFLVSMLGDGPMAATEVQKRAKASGISLTTLDRAAKELEVVKSKEAFTGGWIWSLPGQLDLLDMVDDDLGEAIDQNNPQEHIFDDLQ